MIPSGLLGTRPPPVVPQRSFSERRPRDATSASSPRSSRRGHHSTVPRKDDVRIAKLVTEIRSACRSSAAEFDTEAIAESSITSVSASLSPDDFPVGRIADQVGEHHRLRSPEHRPSSSFDVERAAPLDEHRTTRWTIGAISVENVSGEVITSDRRISSNSCEYNATNRLHTPNTCRQCGSLTPRPPMVLTHRGVSPSHSPTASIRLVGPLWRRALDRSSASLHSRSLDRTRMDKLAGTVHRQACV